MRWPPAAIVDGAVNSKPDAGSDHRCPWGREKIMSLSLKFIAGLGSGGLASWIGSHFEQGNLLIDWLTVAALLTLLPASYGNAL